MKSVWTLGLLVSLLAPIGCGKDECEVIYEAESKCRGKEGDKDRFMTACAAAKSEEPEEFAVAAKCAKEDSCEAMKACQKAARGAKRAKEVAAAVSAGKWKDAWDDCTIIPEYYGDPSFKAECLKVFAEAPTKLSAEELRTAGFRCENGKEIAAAVPEFKQTCEKMNSGKLAAATAAVTKARDTGVRDYKACFELETAAKTAGGDAVAKAKTLCDEASKADDAKKGMESAREYAKAEKKSFPYQCSSVPKDLDAIGTEWAKAKKDELLKACYVELGKVVIDASAKDAKYSCPYGITQVLEANKLHDLATKFPELAEVLGRLPEKCKS